MKKVIMYKCSYCNTIKPNYSKEVIIEHESRCFFNPKNKACKTCANFSRRLINTRVETELYTGYIYGCKHYNIEIKKQIEEIFVLCNRADVFCLVENKKIKEISFAERPNVPMSNCENWLKKRK